MCGIAGKLTFDGRPVIASGIRAMNDRITHRGPDDAGVYINPRGDVGFGHRRLAIIDLSPAGHQPMCNEDGTVWIVFNGEIYNFQELRPLLERRGHKFRSLTDTEAIIHCYEEFGVECLQHLRGMFAFAVWDDRKRHLFLARDRVGKKPIKYYLNDRGIVFASELKAFIDDPDVPRELDEEAIAHYLTFQYVPHPMTGFRGVQKLPPAHFLLIDCSRTTPVIRGPERYWDLRYDRKLDLPPKEWHQRILDKLDECVRLRMIADVPLGAFLSGGVDSSAIVASMARQSTNAIKTFSIGFAEHAYNELPYARMVANRYHTDHQEFILEPNAIEILPLLVSHYEEPYADSSALPTYYLAKMTRQHVTVALNGDGGDENFAGYPWYRLMRLAEMYRHLPQPLRQFNVWTMTGLQSLRPHSHVLRYGRLYAEACLRTRAALHTELLSYFNARERAMLYPRDRHHLNSTRYLDRYHARVTENDVIDATQYADINTYLADDLLAKVDIATMAVALEARSPMLDHEFMELVAQIPSRLKVCGVQGKHVFKEALRSRLPDGLLFRKKQGFSVPIDSWFRDSLRTYVADTLLGANAFVANYFQRSAIQRLFDNHQHGGRESRRLWALLTLELWYQQFHRSRAR